MRGGSHSFLLCTLVRPRGLAECLGTNRSRRAGIASILALQARLVPSNNTIGSTRGDIFFAFVGTTDYLAIKVDLIAPADQAAKSPGGTMEKSSKFEPLARPQIDKIMQRGLPSQRPMTPFYPPFCICDRSVPSAYSLQLPRIWYSIFSAISRLERV
jgi:hypothetical protein